MLLLLLLLQLAKEGREEQKADEVIRPGAESDDSQQVEQKRGRWQGFCFRKSRSGRIHPYICWKGCEFVRLFVCSIWPYQRRTGVEGWMGY